MGQGVGVDSHWNRLKRHLVASGQHIVRLYLQFRSHIIDPLPPHAAAYFFCHSIVCTSGEEARHAFVIGHAQGQSVHTMQYGVPELDLITTGTRPLRTDDPCLIFA